MDPKQKASRGRVLVVDDNEDAADLLGELLTTAGYDVRVANDGPSALELATEFGPMVALLDIGLPGMDGHELAAKLRAAHQRVGLVALTGYRPDPTAAETASCFDRHLVKPVGSAELLAVVGDFVGRAN